jgi:hypothetical protein
MSTEFTPHSRLVRKRNHNLQKQLDVTLHLLTQEYRQVKERMYKDERDCGKFLQVITKRMHHLAGCPIRRILLHVSSCFFSIEIAKFIRAEAAAKLYG